MNRAVAMLLLGLFGAALSFSAFFLLEGTVLQFSPAVVIAALVPFVSKKVAKDITRTRVFADCVIVGVIMVGVLYGAVVGVVHRPPFTVLDHLWRVGFLILCVVAGSTAVAVIDRQARGLRQPHSAQ